MEAAADLSSVLTIAESIASIFGIGGGSSGSLDAETIAVLQDMLDNLVSEVEEVFLYDLTEADVYTATGVAQSAHDFLAVNYANGQANGETAAELWTLLTADTAASRLADLSTQASIMLSWTTSNQQTQTAQQTISLALTIYTLIVAFYRERASNAPTQQVAAAELANMHDYASLGVQRIQPLVQAVSTARMNAIGNPIAHHQQVVSTTGHLFQFWSYTVQDAWPPQQPLGTVLSVGQEGDKSANRDRRLLTQIQSARNLYRNICQGADDASMASWSNSLSSAVEAGYFVGNASVWQEFNTSFSQPTIAKVLKTLNAGGEWFVNAQKTLQNLQALASYQPATAPTTPPVKGSESGHATSMEKS